MTEPRPTIDRGAAVTRSLLGWGVVAGPFYVVVGLVLALTRRGFELTEHALSLLMLGDGGWMQRANFVLTGLMVLAAAYGIRRAAGPGRGVVVAVLAAVFAACLLLAAVFPPDPVAGFPPGATAATTTGGLLHLAFGGIGFVSLATAGLVHPTWSRRVGAGRARWSAVLGAVVAAAFVGGAALATSPVGVGLLWLAVLAGWLWLALVCARLYRWTPHPSTGERR